MSLITIIRAHPRVEHVEDQRPQGGGVVITLRKGFTFDRGTDTRTHREKTLSGALTAVRLAYRFGELAIDPTRRMMKGQEPYTPAELAKLQSTISDICDIEDEFPADFLER